MPTGFPAGLDNFTNPVAGDNLDTAGVVHSDLHANAFDAIEALEAKVGVDGSAVATTLDYLSKRIPANSGTIATAETTTSTVYTDLATVGPVVSRVTGSSALVILTAKLGATATNPDTCYVGFAVSGATTVAAADARALTFASFTLGALFQGSALFVVTGLTPGTNTFTMKYRQNGNSTGTYSNRTIVVIPL